MKNSVQILDEKAQLKSRAEQICNQCKIEIRDFTDAEKQEIDGITENLKELDKELRALESEVELGSNKPKTNKVIMKKNFSLLRTINDIANNRSLSDVSMAVVNKGDAEFRAAGISTEGQIQLPSESRAVISVENEGEDVVETEFTNILEPLRAKNVLVQAGARFITGLVGDLQVPIMDGGNVFWEGETSPAQDGAGSFSNVKLSPKRLTAYVDISKQFLVQDSLDAENLIKQDICNAVNTKLEQTILGVAAGTATQPAGIGYGITPMSIAAFDNITVLEAQIAMGNFLGTPVYIMDNMMKAALRCLPKGVRTSDLTTYYGSAVFENGAVDGTPVFISNNMSGGNSQTGHLYYGDFSNLAIAQWGGIDLTVDPYTQAASGKIRLVINAFFDAKLLRSNAIVGGIFGA